MELGKIQVPEDGLMDFGFRPNGEYDPSVEHDEQPSAIAVTPRESNLSFEED